MYKLGIWRMVLRKRVGWLDGSRGVDYWTHLLLAERSEWDDRFEGRLREEKRRVVNNTVKQLDAGCREILGLLPGPQKQMWLLST